MAEVIQMPRLSDTMEEGNIVAWHKAEGDKIEPGDLLAEIETDKATMDFESLWEGHLLHIAVKEGAVPVESVIAVIGNKGEDWQAAITALNGASNGQAEVPAATVEVKAAAAVAPMTAVAETAATHSAGRIMASPLAKNIAKEAGIDLSSIAGSGGKRPYHQKGCGVIYWHQTCCCASTCCCPTRNSFTCCPCFQFWRWRGT